MRTIAAALVLVGASVRMYLNLALAPVYITWKVGLYARALVTPGNTAWVRTARTP